ncbi:MAG TPA: HAMP domain-containing sensor histidine kinase [Bdellovibrionota bacterium]|nr:HAMP domain-containing sensor histidine kinase [Bdellovibrionota bacterium]
MKVFSIFSTLFKRKSKPDIQHLQKIYHELEALDKAKSDFLTLISHEIRTPLAVINSSLELLKTTEEPESRSKLMDMAKKHVARLRKFAEYAIDISALDIGKLELKKESFMINEVIDEVMNRYAPSIESKVLTLYLESHGEPIFIFSHKEKIKNILSELIENAIENSDEQKNIFIEIHRDEKYCTVCIRDQGAGIEEDMKDLVFEPMTKMGDILSHSKGTGLSMYWAKKILALLGGEISFTSHKGEGTEFVFKAPLALSKRLAA